MGVDVKQIEISFLVDINLCASNFGVAFLRTDKFLAPAGFSLAGGLSNFFSSLLHNSYKVNVVSFGFLFFK